jgi:hypothetical protein
MDLTFRPPEQGTESAIFDRYRPPFDLTSDMLLALAFCPTSPLRQAFPETPFLSLLGWTPLVVWFSRITEGWYRDPAGRPRLADEGIPYNELNVLALLRAPAVFVPGIYASSELSVRIGHGYGMPKQLVPVDFGLSRARLAASADEHGHRSHVAAMLLGSGRGPARLLSPFWPLHTWPVCFPSGTGLQAVVRAIRGVQLAYIRRSQLALRVPWLPRPVRLQPVGVYLSDLQFRLPPPGAAGHGRKRDPCVG